MGQAKIPLRRKVLNLQLFSSQRQFRDGWIKGSGVRLEILSHAARASNKPKNSNLSVLLKGNTALVE